MPTIKQEPGTAALMMVPPMHPGNHSKQLDRMEKEKEAFSGSMHAGLSKQVSYQKVTPSS